MTTQLELLNKFNKKEKLFNEEMKKIYKNRYTDYRNKYFNQFKHAEDLNFPLYIMLEQTYKCNLSCPSCIHGYDETKAKYDVKDSPSVMEMELFKKIVDEASKFKCPSLAVMVNDEPLLVKNIGERIKYAKDKGFMDIIMTTNGNLLTEKKIKEVVEAGITRILFSVDAASQETYKITRPGKGSFEKVINNMKLLRDYKIKQKLIIPYTRASMVISKNNQHEINKFINYFSDLVDGVEFQTISTYYNLMNDLIPEGRDVKKVTDFSCSEPWQKIIIRQNGDVLPCCSYYGYQLKMGNVKETSIYDVYNSAKFKKIKNEVKLKEYSNIPCTECSKSLYKVEIKSA